MKSVIITFLMAMVPIVELRGAIPWGVGVGGLTVLEASLIAIAGNMLPVPFIVIFIKRIFALLKTKSEWLNNLVVRLENRAASKQEVVERFEFWGLVVLVAIPLPGTGAWTGALVAGLMDMRLKRAFPAIFIGVFIASCIVSWITFGGTQILE